MDDSKMNDIVKNFEQYGYAIETRDSAQSILMERGFKNEDLIFHGENKANNALYAKDLMNSRSLLFSYSLYATFYLLYF